MRVLFDILRIIILKSSISEKGSDASELLEYDDFYHDLNIVFAMHEYVWLYEIVLRVRT